ncbi:hypothetical protein [Kingella oralis]|uniref:hypothetical protein n=1 Tax=Kingella oralis TaxID=505 RepID=UPI002D7F95E0|nr:hypothetical protein [Kingella oralis]
MGRQPAKRSGAAKPKPQGLPCFQAASGEHCRPALSAWRLPEQTAYPLKLCGSKHVFRLPETMFSVFMLIKTRHNNRRITAILINGANRFPYAGK